MHNIYTLNPALHFHANGKFLLTSEYFVMHGAEALALPLKLGQELYVEKDAGEPVLSWSGIAPGGEWFRASFALPSLDILDTTNEEVSKRLRQLLKMMDTETGMFQTSNGIRVRTMADFNLQWGLGSSSTLVHLLSQWAKTNPYPMQFQVFGGSGYDIACAGADGPLLYQRIDDQPQVTPVDFAPSFAASLHFVYTGRKMDSRKAIEKFKTKNHRFATEVERYTALTAEFLHCTQLGDFERLIATHEHAISEALDQPRIKEAFFPDFPGEIKSLGGWGGDFVLATGEKEAVRSYFFEKELETIFGFEDIVRYSHQYAKR